MPLKTVTRGFTLIELIAVTAIIVLLAATFVPYAMSLRENGNRVGCVAKLGSIWWALDQYQRLNNHAYPRTRFDERLGNRWTAFTGADDANPFAPSSAVAANDVSAALWLLVRTVDAKPEWFVCPSSEGTPDRAGDPRSRGNFRGAEQLSYAIASPYSSVADYALSDTLPANFALVADQGPSAAMLAPGRVPAASAGPQALAMGNSVNHRRAGQNVLYPFGQVVFQTTPYSGVGRVQERDKPFVPGDNIYTALAPSPLVDARPDHAGPGFAGVGVGPSYRYDAYLIPGADFPAAAAVTDSTPTSARVAASTSPSDRPASRPATTPATTQAVP